MASTIRPARVLLVTSSVTNTGSHAKHSYLAISAFVRRELHSTTHSRTRHIRSDFANQPFTGSYEPGQPTTGPLGDIPLIGRMGPTPKALKHHLDHFVVGQDRAKKVMSTAVFNHYQRVLELRRREEEEQQLLQQRLRRERSRPHPLEDEYPGHQESIAFNTSLNLSDESQLRDSVPLSIEKSNVLLLGPTGVGKTLMAKTLARVLEVPFSMSDCTPFTQAGYIGEDVQICVERLLVAANYDVEAAEFGIIVLDEIDKIAAQKSAQGRDVGGEGVQQALLKIIEGTTLHIQVKPGSGTGTRATGATDNSAGNAAIGSKFASSNSNGSATGSAMPSTKSETFSIKTDNILFIFTGAFIGLHKHILSRIQKGSIGFGSSIQSAATLGMKEGDEILSVRADSEEGKLFEKHLPFHSSPVRRSVLIKYNPLDLVEPTDLQAFGMIPELVGRIPVISSLTSLDIDALVRVLTEPRSSLVKQYKQLFHLSGIDLHFTTESLQEIAKTAFGMGTGARALRTCVERLLSEAMFEAPGSSIKYILITGAVARRESPPVYLARGQQHKFESMIANEEKSLAEKHSKQVASQEDIDATDAKTFEEYRNRSTAAGYI